MENATGRSGRNGNITGEDTMEDVICILKPHLIKNLKTDLLIMNSSFDDIISRAQEREMMRLIRQDNMEAAADLFLNTLLQSDDPAKWSLFRVALCAPEHALIVDILNNGETDDIRMQEELQRAVDLFRGPLVQTLDPMMTSQYLLQAGLLSNTEIQRVIATQREYGDNMANFLLLTYVPRNKDWYLKFMKIVWLHGHKNLVKLIDPDVFEKMAANHESNPPDLGRHEGPNSDGNVSWESTNVKFVAHDPGEPSAKLSSAPTVRHMLRGTPAGKVPLKIDPRLDELVDKSNDAPAGKGRINIDPSLNDLAEKSSDRANLNILSPGDDTVKLAPMKDKVLNIGPHEVNLPTNIPVGYPDPDEDLGKFLSFCG